MALVRTTLTAPITSNQLTFGVASTLNAAFPGVGAAPLTYQAMVIDDEVMFLVSCPATNVVTVRGRGSDGTDAVPHDIGSSVVTTSNAQDWPSAQAGMSTLRPPSTQDIVTYGQSGVIAVPVEGQTTVYLAATSAGAYTLGAPSLALNGIEMTITSQTAFAHVIVATSLFFPSNAAGPLSTATYPGNIGATMQIVAQNGVWNVINASISPVVFT
jgi:hypothetical protein